MQFHDPGSGGEAETSAGELFLGVQARERSEESGGIRGIEAVAVIDQLQQDPFGSRVHLTQHDVCRRLLPGVLHGVAEEILQRELHQHGIGADDDVILDADVDVTVAVPGEEFVGDAAGDRTEVETLGRQGGAAVMR